MVGTFSAFIYLYLVNCWNGYFIVLLPYNYDVTAASYHFLQLLILDKLSQVYCIAFLTMHTMTKQLYRKHTTFNTNEWKQQHECLYWIVFVSLHVHLHVLQYKLRSTEHPDLKWKNILPSVRDTLQKHDVHPPPCFCFPVKLSKHHLLEKQNVRWLRELNALQLQETHANRKSTSKLRKHLHQFQYMCCKCLQDNQINTYICSSFLCLVVLWAFAARVLWNLWSCFWIFQMFFYFQRVKLSRSPYKWLKIWSIHF